MVRKNGTVNALGVTLHKHTQLCKLCTNFSDHRLTDRILELAHKTESFKQGKSQNSPLFDRNSSFGRETNVFVQGQHSGESLMRGYSSLNNSNVSKWPPEKPTNKLRNS